MNGTDQPDPLVETGHREWTPKHGTYTQPVAALYDLSNPAPESGGLLDRYKATTRRIQLLFGEAAARAMRVRAFGGGWSFTEAPATEGWLVNTKPLNLHFRVLPSVVHPGYGADPAQLHFAQCGCSISQLNEDLRAKGRSLRTSGASNGQTIAGAISTGTHGSFVEVSAIQDGVVGLHLVVGPERHVWLERATYPVMRDEFAALLGAEPIRDDGLFDAALVSFGSFGFIHGVMIETDPEYLLESFRQRMERDAGMRKAMTALDFSEVALPGGAERPYFFLPLVNPYRADEVFATVMYRRPFRQDYARPPDSLDGFGVGDDALCFIGQLSDAVPGLIPAVTALLERAQKPKHGELGTLGETFSNTTTRGEAASTAIGLPLERAEEALETVLEIFRTHGPYAAVVALRYVKATRSTLGWTRFAPTTCVLDLDGAKSSRTRDLFERVWQALEDRHIPHTFHWGKQHALDAAGTRRCYGEAASRWIAARETLLDAAARRTFSNRFLEERGLST